jgi:soluble P-type ATPase
MTSDGRLLPDARDRLDRIAELLKIHILTADTFGKAKAELDGINCEIHILTGKDYDVQKEEYVEKLGPESVVAFENGKNDRKMLKVARVGIAVSKGEGCAVDAIIASDIHVGSANVGLDLLLNAKKLKTSLRF